MMSESDSSGTARAARGRFDRVGPERPARADHEPLRRTVADRRRDGWWCGPLLGAPGDAGFAIARRERRARGQIERAVAKAEAPSRQHRQLPRRGPRAAAHRPVLLGRAFEADQPSPQIEEAEGAEAD